MKRMMIVLVCFFTFFTLALNVAADDHHNRRDYEGRHGYRERPYDRHRHYEYQEHRGHRYHYRGHWRSWDDWDRYAREHRSLYRHGHYYREEGHLMFRYCDPDTGNCFFFSIGR